MSKGASIVAASLAASIAKAVEAADAEESALLNSSDSVRVYAHLCLRMGVHSSICLCTCL